MAFIVRASAKGSSSFDPTIYPVEEKVGEDILQRWIVELLRPLIERWLNQRGVEALVGADQFIYHQQHNPTLRVAPDIYVLPGVPPHARVTSWKIWDRGIVPSFALEIVSRDWEKDYFEAPEQYRAMGVEELVVFDPAPERHPEGVTWQVFRRVLDRPLARVDVSDDDRIRSAALGCFLRTVGTGDGIRLRIGAGPDGNDLFPTGEEAERTAKEAERAAKEAERTAKEAAIAAKDAAEARVAELESELRRRR
jgi:Uma2 family endonuclease